MNSNFERIRQIFLAIAEEPSAQWDTLLDQACGTDLELRAQVALLLKAHGEGEGILDQNAAGGSPTGAYEPLREQPGTVIGPYKLLEQIGEGGFGVVFLAEQQESIRRKVALKVLKPGMDTRQVVARFEAERQALALMDHPHIAKVFDGGTTPSGRPYFVMELVRGVPITDFCDQNRLAPRARLELFLDVCQAVQHAHQKGIIHRDLKPSNVLVSRHDTTPIVKVIDFGVAKALGQELTDKTLFTGIAQMVGTPLYMSPEQAGMSDLDVDTRSDIYSLGVLLYELLTGTTPFEKDRFKQAGYDELRRIIREEEPPRPSTRLSTAGPAATSISANRGTELARLTRLLRGELDWIVMKALEKDRNRRYDTANGFALDVQRYLADEPVLAGPPSARYRFRKFARRNRRRLAVGAIVGILLLGAGALAWHTNQQAAERRAEAARQEGEERGRRSRNAEAVAILLDQCEEALRGDRADRAAIALGAAERRAADGGAEELASRQAHCQADLKLLRELNDMDRFRWTWAGRAFPHPWDVAARWRAALAKYGLTPDAGRAEELAAKVNGSLVRERVLIALDGWLVRDPSAEVRAGLGAILRSADPDSYRNAVRDAVAARLGRPMLALADQPEALAQPPWFAATLGRLDVLPADRRRVVLESALRTKPGDLHLLMALGGSYRSTQPEGAGERVRWYQAAVAVHPENLAARTNLGLALMYQGNLDAAIACFREIIRLDPKFALAHNNVGWILQLQGKTDEAIAAYRDAIRADRELALAHGNLGAVLMNKRHLDAAKEALREAERLDPNDAMSRENLGSILLEQMKWTEAEETLKNCLAIRRKTAPEDWKTFKTMVLLGAALLEQEKSTDAEPLLVQGYEGMKAREKHIPATDKPLLMMAVDMVVHLYDANGPKEKADQWRKKLQEAKAAKDKPDQK
jgi:serine/threonine protein kinase/Tfp pilus assembly protein PilF